MSPFLSRSCCSAEQLRVAERTGGSRRYHACMEYRFARAQVVALVLCATAVGLNADAAVLLFSKGRVLAGSGCSLSAVLMMLVVAMVLRSGRVASAECA